MEWQGRAHVRYYSSTTARGGEPCDDNDDDDDSSKTGVVCPIKLSWSPMEGVSLSIGLEGTTASSSDVQACVGNQSTLVEILRNDLLEREIAVHQQRHLLEHHHLASQRDLSIRNSVDHFTFTKSNTAGCHSGSGGGSSGPGQVKLLGQANLDNNDSSASTALTASQKGKPVPAVLSAQPLSQPATTPGNNGCAVGPAPAEAADSSTRAAPGQETPVGATLTGEMMDEAQTLAATSATRKEIATNNIKEYTANVTDPLACLSKGTRSVAPHVTPAENGLPAAKSAPDPVRKRVHEGPQSCPKRQRSSDERPFGLLRFGGDKIRAMLAADDEKKTQEAWRKEREERQKEEKAKRKQMTNPTEAPST